MMQVVIALAWLRTHPLALAAVIAVAGAAWLAQRA